MSIKSDKWIKEMAESHKMIEPYQSGQVRRGENEERLISYGTSSYGYDVRCSNEFKVFTNIHSATVDPKNFDENSFVDVKSDVCVIPPNSFALASTLEFSNTTSLPAKIYANEGVAQMLFLESDEECEVSYRDRGGKYQGQTGVTLPKA